MEYGAAVGDLRPSELYDYRIGVSDIVAHELQQLAKQNLASAEFCLIYATTLITRVSYLNSNY